MNKRAKKGTLIDEIRNKPIMYVYKKFGKRFDLKQLLTDEVNNKGENLYKLVDSQTDNVWFKTAKQLNIFSPTSFNKHEFIEEMSEKFGHDRFDFSKSVILNRKQLFEYFDNYLLHSRFSYVSKLRVISIVEKPDRMKVVKKIIAKFGNRFNTDTMIYQADHIPLIIYDNWRKCNIHNTVTYLMKLSNKQQKRNATKGKRAKLDPNKIFDILVNLHPNYLFNKYDFFIKTGADKRYEVYIKYTDLTNGETYSHQTLSSLMHSRKRRNHGCRTEKEVIKQMKLRIRNLDVDQIIFPKKDEKYDFPTKYYITTGDVIEYKMLNGTHFHKIKAYKLFKKLVRTTTSPYINSNKYTRFEIINRFKKVDIYNIFKFDSLIFSEHTKFNLKKKFKIYNTKTEKFIFINLHDFKTQYLNLKLNDGKIFAKDTKRMGNREKYIYLDKSDTTKKGHVDVICPEHGIFSQWSDNHFYRGDCCPLCNASVGETKIYNYFYEKEIKFNFKFKAHKLMKLDYLRFDFYLPEFDIYIQFNGEHHHKTVKWSNSMDDEELLFRLQTEQENDRLKFEYCKKNNLDLIVLDYWQRDDLEMYLQAEFDKLIEKRKV